MTMSEIRVVCQVPNLREEKALEQKATARLPSIVTSPGTLYKTVFCALGMSLLLPNQLLLHLCAVAFTNEEMHEARAVAEAPAPAVVLGSCLVAPLPNIK